MNRLLFLSWLVLLPSLASAQDDAKPLRIGIIGLDTSHSIAFTKELNQAKAPQDLAGVRVVCAYPQGSRDIPSSTSRVPGYTEEIEKLGVEIVDSIPALLERCDCVLLESNDGRPHLEQVIPVLEAGKPVFIDKPLAGSLADCLKIYDLARQHQVPIFSSSSLRFGSKLQALRDGAAGDVLGCEAFSPCALEATHPDLFWYGIHGVEILYTAMGTGCVSVTRAHSDSTDFVTGTWSDGRIGTFRGIRAGKSGYGGRVYGSTAVEDIGGFEGYRPLVVEIVKFFKTGEPPVSAAETLELYAFMEAADESKRQDGRPVAIADVMKRARQKAGLEN